MKSSLKVTVAAIGLVSSILISAAAAPATAKISEVGYIAEKEHMAQNQEQTQLIEIENVENTYEIIEVNNETVKPTKFESKPVSSAPVVSSKPNNSSKPNSNSQASSQSPSGSVQTPAPAVPSVGGYRPTFIDYSQVTTPTPVPVVIHAPNAVPATNRDANGGEALKFKANGTTYNLPVKEALKHVVSNEVNSALTYEAIKAQVVATHSFIKYNNDNGVAPSVGYKKTIDPSVSRAVDEVYNVIAIYGGRAIYAPYFACSAGKTQSAREVWGGSVAHLVSVESKYDYLVDYSNGVKTKSIYLATKTLSADTVKTKIINKLGVTPSGDPSTWFKFLDENNNGYTSGGYINKIVVAGKTTTGKKVRDIFGLRSACFDVTYANGTFTFKTRGYGHGAGMSQWGAHFYALKDGWNYQQIITHYYKGVSIATVA